MRRNDTSVNRPVHSQTTLRISSSVLWFAFIYAAATLVYGLYAGRAAYSVAASLAMGPLVWALRLPERRRSQAAFVLGSLFAAAYACELVIAVALPFRGGIAAFLDKRNFDFRTYDRIVRDLREEGVEAYPCLFPRALLREPDFPLDGLPLGSLARTQTVYCNEGGAYLTYLSDEHGFHNPVGLWRPELDVAVVGDSFAQGACVPSDRNLAGLVRRRFPRTLNLGMGGNGPLLTLAAMQEYLPDLRPKLVLWFFYEGNDLDDLNEEIAHPVLHRYLAEPAFRQGLAAKQADIDAAWRGYADTRMDLGGASPLLPDSLVHRLDLRTTLARVVRLSHLRGAFNTAFDDPLGYSVYDHDVQAERLRAVLERANELVRSWDGRLCFIVLPSWDLAVHSSERRRRVVEQALDAARRAGVESLDLTPAMRSLPEPSRAFYYPGSHYSDLGYQLVAETTLAEFGSFQP